MGSGGGWKIEMLIGAPSGRRRGRSQPSYDEYPKKLLFPKRMSLTDPCWHTFVPPPPQCRAGTNAGAAAWSFVPDEGRRTMGEFTDKVSAAANKVAGKIKEEVGKATDNERLEAEGEAQQLKGTGQDVKGSVKGALGDKI
jgi:uncharacterized protein YjbJ (UPF0337 family)